MWQTLLTPVDLYCERTGPGLWEEPANALTNLAFIAAGLWAFGRCGDTGPASSPKCWPGGWWRSASARRFPHLRQQRHDLGADILPIAGFTLAYTLFNRRRFVGMEWGKAILVFVAFYVVAGLITYAVPDWLRQASNGTTGYLPALSGARLLRHMGGSHR